MDIDIGSLRTSTDAEWFQLAHPDVEDPLTRGGKPVEWQINSPVSEAVRAHERRVGQRSLDAVGRTGKMIKPDYDTHVVKAELDKMCVAVAGWRNFAIDGKEVPFSPEKVREILSDPGYDWLLAWVKDKFASGNFRGASALTPKK